jgi:hypothetical protein
MRIVFYGFAFLILYSTVAVQYGSRSIAIWLKQSGGVWRGEGKAAERGERTEQQQQASAKQQQQHDTRAAHTKYVL